MNNKLKILLLNLIIAFSVTSPVFALDDLDDLGGSWKTPYKAKVETDFPLDQKIVPRFDGTPQSNEDFELLFTGKEDATTVRLNTWSSRKHFTFREKLKYTLEGTRAYGSLSGTVTSHGILTNGHGFVEEVPCIQNAFYSMLGIQRRYYRPLKPIKIEQGLTVEHFESEDKISYYDPDFLLNFNLSAHAVYSKEDVESISLMEGYLIPSRTKRNGWIFGTLNTDKDVALVKIKKNEHPNKICQITEELPSQETPVRKVSIYQYPLGHPLQKKSFGMADFLNKRHFCVTEGGSSGSGVRDFETGYLFGVHSSGNIYYNKFIPFDLTMLSLMNMQVYPSPKIKEVDF